LLANSLLARNRELSLIEQGKHFEDQGPGWVVTGNHDQRPGRTGPEPVPFELELTLIDDPKASKTALGAHDNFISSAARDTTRAATTR